MATKKPETDFKQAFAGASRRLPMTIKKLPPATRTRRQAARTAWTVSRLLESYRDPRAVLLEIAGTDTAELARTIGCSLLEALAERRLAAQAVLPWVASRLPISVDLKHARTINLAIIEPGAAVPAGHTSAPAPGKLETLIDLAAPQDGADAPLIEAQLLPALGQESDSNRS